MYHSRGLPSLSTFDIFSSCHKLLSSPETDICPNQSQMRALALPSSKYGRLVLWDSQGVKQSNQIYVDMIVKYLGDKYNELTGHPAEACTRPWRKIDDSGNSPRQSNGYDCGIFTLTSISLLAQQTPLTTRSYTEAEFQLQDTRKRIAFLLWQASRNQPRPRQRSRPSLSTFDIFSSCHKLLSSPETDICPNQSQMRALALPSSKYGRLVLWDSQGVKQSNQIYVDMIVKYLGDKYNELTGHPAEACTRPWRKIDDSGNSPRQSNGYDCGIFTLTSISLLAQQTPLTTRSYTEAEFQLQDTRKRIAFLLWQASRNQPRPRQRSRSATSSRTPPLIKSTTLRPRKTSSRHTVTN